MIKKIGRKIYYDKATGNVIVDTGEMQGYVRETTEAEDFQRYEALKGLNRDSVGVLKLAFGQFSHDFAQANGYRVNSVGKLEFSYGSEGQEPMFQKPLTEQIEELQQKLAIAEKDNLTSLLAITELYETILGG